jgi:hypothetical protein
VIARGDRHSMSPHVYVSFLGQRKFHYLNPENVRVVCRTNTFLIGFVENVNGTSLVFGELHDDI